ncbi:MAG: thiol:disulfide interchange protein DsbA/DsbL [Gammaproteobacteria bacterium]|nr:thiol:disulfide interchange protein DsbA/DsbL [Gammaproteobacteria bacterium]
MTESRFEVGFDMRSIFFRLFLVTLLLVGHSAYAQDASTGEYVSGTHYEELNPRQPTSTSDDTVEVVEIFAYSCPHCNAFEEPLGHWKDTRADYITFIRIHADWGHPVAELHSRAYYTAEALGILEQTHPAFFHEFHERRNYLETREKLVEFFARFDIDEAKFNSTFDSFLVNSKVQKGRDLIRRYNVSETPTVVVNGRYVTKGNLAGTYGNWFGIIDELAAREHDASD